MKASVQEYMQDKDLVFRVLTQGAVAMNLMLKLHHLKVIFFFLEALNKVRKQMKDKMKILFWSNIGVNTMQ